MTLPDATEKSVAIEDGNTSKYNLRTRDPNPVTNRPHSDRPHREATKSLSLMLNQQMKAVRTHRL